MGFDLIIFDCDGVLVDSEPIANQIFHQMLVEEGLLFSYEEVFGTFTGLSLRSCIELIQREKQITIGPDFPGQYRLRTIEALKKSLRPVPGIVDALSKIEIPVCVASGSSHERINLSLELTGLLPRFENKIFSVSDVGRRGKPAPDIFLYAARRLGCLPEKAAVVEDSIPGVKAGVAAGMTVYAYSGSVGIDQLKQAGAHYILDDMAVLPKLLDKKARTI